MSSSEPKIYAPEEERINVWSHAVGVFSAPLFLGLLLCFSRSSKAIFACSLYMVSLTAMYLGSSLYHAAKEPPRRALLRRFDHAAIYFLISGTYTPLMLLCVGGPTGTVILGISWTIALVGMTLEFLGLKPFKGFSIILYLISGWLCIVILPRLIASLSPQALGFLIGGGVVYSLGVIFYVSRKKYAHAIWHVFVLGGAFCHYCTILLFLMRHSGT